MTNTPKTTGAAARAHIASMSDTAIVGSERKNDTIGDTMRRTGINDTHRKYSTPASATESA